MKENRKGKAKVEAAGRSVPVRMPEALEAKVASAAGKTGLAKQDVMRLAIDRGVDVLLSQLLRTTPSVGACE